jgi:hypothetical protein
MPDESAVTETEPETILVPGHRFFTRLVEVPPEVADNALDGFARLTLEGLSPFPAAHLAVGWHLFEKTRTMLVFAAYRKSFEEGFLEAWYAARRVVPDFAPALVVGRSEASSRLVIWRTVDCATAILWPRDGTAPKQLVCRRFDAADSREIEDAFRKLLKLPESGIEVIVLKPAAGGGIQTERTGSLISCEAEGALAPPGVSVGNATVEAWDVRPPEFLLKARADSRRAELLWRTGVGLALACGFLLLGEIGLIVLNTWNAQRSAFAMSRSSDVQAVQDSEQLANRITQLTRMQLRPFEKLALLEEMRSDTLVFTRVNSTNLDTLVVDASARNPGDVPIFEGRLQQLPVIQSAATRNQQFRDNVTTFTLEVVFKPEEFDRALEERRLAESNPAQPAESPETQPVSDGSPVSERAAEEPQPAAPQADPLPGEMPPPPTELPPPPPTLQPPPPMATTEA